MTATEFISNHSHPLLEQRATLVRALLDLTGQRSKLTSQDRSNLATVKGELRNLDTELAIERKAAFVRFLRFGMINDQFNQGISDEDRFLLGSERRDLGIGTPTSGAYPGSTTGFFSPLSFQEQVTGSMKWFGPMLTEATIVPTASGSPRGFPTDSDSTISGEQMNENVQSTEIDVPVAQVTLGSFKYGSRFIKLSTELVQDQDVDLFSYLADRAGSRLGRVMNPALTTGAGTTQPTGILTAITAASGYAPVTAIGSAANTGLADGTNTIGLTDLSNLEASVNWAYRKRSKFMMNSGTFQHLRGMVSKQGQYVFPGLHNGGVNTILNYEIAINNDMASLQTTPSSPQASALTVLFGDIHKYTIRQTPLFVMRLPLRFVDYGQVGFLAWQRIDANLLDVNAVNVLVNKF